MKCGRRILPAWRGINLLDVNNEVIHAYVQARRMETVKRKDGTETLVKGRTVRTDLQVLSCIFTHAKKTTSLIKYNPIIEYDKGDLKLNERTRFAELDEMQRLLAAARKCCNPDMHDIILMAFLMGLRQGELFLNKWSYLGDRK